MSRLCTCFCVMAIVSSGYAFAKSDTKPSSRISGFAVVDTPAQATILIEAPKTVSEEIPAMVPAVVQPATAEPLLISPSRAGCPSCTLSRTLQPEEVPRDGWLWPIYNLFVDFLLL